MKVINEGIIKGYVYNFKKDECKYNKLSKDPLKEKELFLRALNNCYKNLKKIEEKTTGTVNAIINSHLEFLKDEIVVELVFKRIDDHHESAGYAYTKVIDEFVGNLNKIEDEYLKERVNDFLDIKDKVIRQMYGKEELFKFDKPTVLIVDKLETSTAIKLTNNVKAVIAKVGGNLSHAAILLKERDIPYVVIKDVDFKEGELVKLNTYNKSILKTDEFVVEILKERRLDLLYDDVSLFVNISSIDDIEESLNENYKGVGLVRTENLFLNDNGYPSIEQQISYYKKLSSSFYPKPVKIRLFDIKKDKDFCLFVSNDVDEFLFEGPFSLLYKEQLEAIILANELFGNLTITIPMIKDYNEYEKVKDYLIKIQKKHNIVREIPYLGIMLETKKAFNNINSFKSVDYISIGTNDLIKDFYNIKREEQANIAKYNEEIIKKLEKIKKYLNKEKIPYFICGNLASTEEGLKKLLDNGENSFSIANGFLNKAIKIINNY